MTEEKQDILDQMLLDVKEHQGETGVGTVVKKGGGDVPPMIISSISGGGKVKVYDTLTGEMSWVLYNKDTGGMLRGVLTQKRENGTRMYTLDKPNFEPVKGTLQCFLHKDNPNRVHYTEMGLPVCRKSNITAPFMVEQHMKNRHPSAWKIIQREKEDLVKQEEREFQRSIISLAVSKGDEAPLYVSKKDKLKK